MKRLLNKDLLPLKVSLVKKQGGKCPLCERSMKSFQSKNICLDHDHTTGVIRGALCRNCNGQEGRIKSRAIRCSSRETYKDWLQRLVQYYSLHETPQISLLHPTFRTEREKRELRNKRARNARKKAKGG